MKNGFIKWLMRSSPFNPLSANPTKWSNSPKQFVGCSADELFEFVDHIVGLAFKGLRPSFPNVNLKLRAAERRKNKKGSYLFSTFVLGNIGILQEHFIRLFKT